MGNRAVITTEAKEMGIYLHWNGGRDSVEAFLHVCNRMGFRCPENDNYGWARLAQVIGNYFDSGLSVGIGPLDQLDTDNGDNGTYIIKDWKIIGREHFSGREQQEYALEEMIEDIIEEQPEAFQKAYKKIMAESAVFTENSE